MSTPLVYIGGAARSGSTLLERLLSCVPGFCPVGELVFIWERGLRRNDLCSCGTRFRDCEYWDRVGQAGFGGWAQVDIDEAVALRRAVDRHRNFGRLAGLRPAGPLTGELNAYTELTGRLYAAVREVSGASVIVDSSKHVGYGLVLSRLPEFDARLVHLIRRSHGVAHSWSKRVRKPSVGDGSTFMSVHSPAWTIAIWMADNLLYDAARRRLRLATLVRYEELITEHEVQLQRILADLDLLPSGPEGSAPLSMTVLDEPTTVHALSGNPMRFQQTTLTIKPDDEWRRSMPRPRRALISAATWPLLWRYGYAGTAGKPRGQ